MSVAPDSRRSPERDMPSSLKANVSAQRAGSKVKAPNPVSIKGGHINISADSTTTSNKPPSPKKPGPDGKPKKDSPAKKDVVKTGRVQKTNLDWGLKACAVTAKTGPTGRPTRRRGAPARLGLEDAVTEAATPVKKTMKKATTKKVPAAKPARKAAAAAATTTKRTPAKKVAGTPTIKKKATPKKGPARKTAPAKKRATAVKKAPAKPAQTDAAPAVAPAPAPALPSRVTPAMLRNNARTVSANEIPGIFAPGVWENRPANGACG